MDWKLIRSTFAAIFLAELGDKTQIAALTLAASSQRPLSVFVGAGAALIIVTALGVAFGAAMSDVVPLALVRKLGAVGLVVTF